MHVYTHISIDINAGAICSADGLRGMTAGEQSNQR